MAKSAKPVPTSGEQLPAYFVVEIKTAEGPHYALCERMTVVAPGADSLPPAVLESIFRENPLRAVALPADPQAGTQNRGLTELMTLFQSGRAPSINITIHNHDQE